MDTGIELSDAFQRVFLTVVVSYSHFMARFARR